MGWLITNKQIKSSFSSSVNAIQSPSLSTSFSLPEEQNQLHSAFWVLPACFLPCPPTIRSSSSHLHIKAKACYQLLIRAFSQSSTVVNQWSSLLGSCIFKVRLLPLQASVFPGYFEEVLMPALHRLAGWCWCSFFQMKCHLTFRSVTICCFSNEIKTYLAGTHWQICLRKALLILSNCLKIKSCRIILTIF